MAVERDAKDDVVRGEIDLDHDVTLGHLLEQGLRVVLVQDGHAVPDAFGVAEIDGLADVEAEAGGRDEAGRKLSRVKRDVNLWVDAVEVVEHAHLARVLAHGEEVVFRLDEVETDDDRVRCRCLGSGDLKGEQGLGEDELGLMGTEHLVEEADLDRAGWRGVRLSAVLDGVARSKGVGEVLAIGRDVVAEAVGEKLVAELRELAGRGASDVLRFERQGRWWRVGPVDAGGETVGGVKGRRLP